MKREKKVRFPTREELECLTDDAVPLAQKQAKKYRITLASWTVVDAISEICLEPAFCDQPIIEDIATLIHEDRKLI